VITAVLDTNVLASGALAHRGAVAEALDALLTGAFQLVLSQEILSELERTLAKPYFAARLPAASVTSYIDGLKATALITPLTIPVAGVATQPEDDVILSTALSGHADILVTGDKHLHALGAYRGVQMLTPAEFVQILNRPPNP
jgi:putative PIN family toxin of toxin-antitoxin system